MEWKEKIKNLSLRGEEIELDIKEISTAFPYLTRLYAEGFFEERSVQNYFEGTDEKSHNFRKYLFMRNIAKNLTADSHFKSHTLLDVLHNMLDHTAFCSVRPAKLDESKVWSYDGIRTLSLDKNYFNLELKSNYAFVHGKNNGMPIVVRGAKENEFELMREWFEERQKSKKNPFIKFKEILNINHMGSY
ncbi:MAG: hypothetical protein N3D84_04140 [Candidatus Woesearchaeota archaeon]|nr:hypothetical protein [Candidatus Woesearchaeota archaeon]